MGNNDFHNLQQLFNTGNTIMTANQKSSCNKNRPSNVNVPNGNLNMNTAMANNNASINNNNSNGKSPFSFSFLPPSNQTATNPLSPMNLPSMAANTNNNNNNTNNNNNASMLTSPSISNQSHGSFSLDHTTTATNTNPLDSRNNSSNANQMMNQSIAGSQNPVQHQQQQQFNSMLSQSRHLPFPYNLNNFHRNY